MSALSGAELLVRALAAHGVDLVFGIPGTHNLEVYRHLTSYGIRHVTTRHEQGAGYAADGYARAGGRVGVALTTSGPAALNVAAAVGQAYSDSVPVLVIAPGMPRDHSAGSGRLHETRDQRGVFAAVAKAALRAMSHADLARVLARAFVELTTGRPGPVYVEVPLDLLSAVDDVADVVPLPVATMEPDADLVEHAAMALGQAQRPLLLLGGGARHAGPEALRIAEALDAPVLTTSNGKGVIAQDHRLSVGAALHLPAAAELMTDSDVVLAVGTELAETDWWSGVPSIGRLIRVDIDPRQLVTNAQPEIAIPGDARRVLDALGTALVPRRSDPERAPAWRARLRAQTRAEGARWLPWLAALEGVLPREATVVADNARAAYYGALGNLPVHHPAGYCFPTGFGTLGYAVPAALGVALATDRPVLAIAGDGGLMFSVQELAAVAAERVSLPVVVFDNGGYGEIRAQLAAAGIDPIGVDLPTPDLVALAVALGGAGQVCTTPAELAAGFTAARQFPGPTLLVVAEA